MAIGIDIDSVTNNSSALLNAFQSGNTDDVISAIPGMSGTLLNQLFPDSYESYEMAIDIVNPDKAGQEDFLKAEFEFTVMPENISAPTQYRTATVPTFGKNVVIDSEVPAAPRFNIRGTFGYNHKLVISKLAPEIKPHNSNPVINTMCTGYALCKRLEKLVELSHKASENGLPFETYLVSKAFNSYWKIELLGVNFVQAVQRNTLWQYDLSIVKVEKPTDKEVKKLKKDLGISAPGEIIKKIVTTTMSPVLSGTTNSVFANILSAY